MSQHKQEDAYDVTSQNFYSWGGKADADKMRAYINEHSKANNLRLLDVVKADGEFVFFWVKK